MMKYSVLVLLLAQVICVSLLYAAESAQASEGHLAPPPLPIPLPVPAPILSKEDTIKQCQENNGVWESYKDKPEIEYCLTPEEKLRKEKCLKYNGNWRPKYGIFQPNSPICINDYPDKYTICHRDADCLSDFCVVTDSTEYGKCARTEAMMCEKENAGFEGYKKAIESGTPRKEVFCVE